MDGGGVLGEGAVADVVLGFHGPVSAQVGGEFGGCCLVDVEAGERVDGLAGLFPAGLFTAAVDAEGELCVGKAMPPRLSAMARVLIERDSRRPCPLFEAVCWMATACQSRPSNWAQAVG